MNTPKNRDTLTGKLEVLGQLQLLIDERMEALIEPVAPDPVNCSRETWNEYRRAQEHYVGQREGLNQAWLLIQQSAVTLKYPTYQPKNPPEDIAPAVP